MKTVFTKILPLFCIATLVSTSFLRADSSLVMISPEEPAHAFHQYKNQAAFAVIFDDGTVQF